MVHLLYDDEIESYFGPAVVMEGSPANIRGNSQTGLRREANDKSSHPNVIVHF